MKAILAVSGFKNSGKTTLCLKLASCLRQMGVRVGFVKHTHEKIMEGMETDTGRFLSEGFPSVLWGPDGLRSETKGEETGLERAVGGLLQGVELVLLEGGKDLRLPRIWVGSPETSPDGIQGVLAWYVREGNCREGPSFFPGEEENLARFISGRLGVGGEEDRFNLEVDGKEIFLKPFLAVYLRESIQGMLRALKNTEGREIAIRIRKGSKNPG